MLNEKNFCVAAYCPPNPAEKGKASQIVAEQYERMRDVGINLVYGHNEAVGGNCESETFVALELCERYGLKYLVKDNIYKRFTALKSDRFKVFKDLNSSEKRRLCDEYERSLARYGKYAAFGGVEFIDEPGYEMFEGIRCAKDVFAKVCSDSLFYVNMLPYWVHPGQMQYGSEYPFFTEKNQALHAEPKQCRYEFFLRSFLETVEPQVLSYDAYPILTLGGENRMVHVALYDHLRIASSLTKERKIPFWNFIQAGGKWEGCENIRVPTESEIALQINVSLAYGATGIQIFPYAYPNDWSDDTVACAGLIGRDGEKTELYEIFKRKIADALYYGNILAKMERSFVCAWGEFCGGLSSYNERLKIPDNDCIFEGNVLCRKIKGVRQIISDSQVLIGVFENGKKTALFIVNNSVVKETDVCVDFEHTMRLSRFEKDGVHAFTANRADFCRLKPGECFMFEYEDAL